MISYEMVSIKTLPKLEPLSLSLHGIIVEAIPLGIASDCSAGLRNASQRHHTGEIAAENAVFISEPSLPLLLSC